jgi:hypothetical protein
MKILMSFYEGKKKIGEEDPNMRGKKLRMCLCPKICLSHLCIFLLSFKLPDLNCLMKRRRGIKVISYEQDNIILLLVLSHLINVNMSCLFVFN